MTARFIRLADYAVAAGAEAMLFTCSAFGPCIDAVKAMHAGIPVLKPKEAMIDEASALALDRAGAIGLLASFAPTLAGMPQEFPPDVPLRLAMAEGALAALERGDIQAHDDAVVAAARTLAAQGSVAIALAQFSLARAAPGVAAACSLPVLTSVDSAVRRLRERCAARSGPGD